MTGGELGQGARVVRELLDRYGPDRLLRVEELGPGVYRGILSGGAQALAVLGTDGEVLVTEAAPCWA